MEILTIDNYNFTATIGEFEYTGIFEVTWPENIAEIQITSIYKDNDDIELINKINPVDLFKLESEIEDLGDQQYWLNDSLKDMLG